MRTLVLIRGAMGVGKSTWIKSRSLEQYTLSADKIRLMCQSPQMLPNGNFGISQSNDKVVWNMLFKFLEERMLRGEFVVIDACNTKTSEMNKYKKLADIYRYRILCVDMTDVPIEIVKHRNMLREPYKRVPESIIDNAYARFKTQKIPSGIEVIKPHEFKDYIDFKTIDLSSYKKISVIGDIHGCYSVLMNYINKTYDNKNKVTENALLDNETMYIFVGDYIDRGKENSEMMNFLFEIMNKNNVILLEGNHEKYFWNWANDKNTKSIDFEIYTKTQFIQNKIDKKLTRMLYRKLRQVAYFTYHDKTFIITHGGISNIPKNLTYVATEQLIKGVGFYKDTSLIYDSFIKNTSENVYQIHGHRNIEDLPTRVNERCFNVNEKVEFGGNLRIVEITEENIETVELPNYIYKEDIRKKIDADIDFISKTNLIIELRKNKDIKEKIFDDISSFNFTKKAFYNKTWNAQTITARGLYLNNQTGDVVLRGYPKFFNINEREDTKIENLKNKLNFPVLAYLKYNGYLGLLSVKDGELIFATKSSLSGDFVKWFKDIFYKIYQKDQIDLIKKYLTDCNSTMIFEVIAHEKDPHMISYTEDKLVLLDIVKNDIKFEKQSYDSLKNICKEINMEYKELTFVAEDWNSFYGWYNTVTSDSYSYNGENIEGFVIEDSNMFMTKIKVEYYNFWKTMRNLKHEIYKKGHTNKTAKLQTPLSNNFYKFLQDLYNKDKENLSKSIIELRNIFYNKE